MTKILDGKKVADQLASEVKLKLEKRKSLGLPVPHLAIILLGDNLSSLTYVTNKIKTFKRVGMKASLFHLKEDTSQEKLLDLVEELSLDDSVDGLIVQLPLPFHIKEEEILLRINPNKDVDGLHPFNMAHMLLNLDGLLPATPLGILELLKAYQIQTKGKHVVIVGRSYIVGRPLSILLSRKDSSDATVTLAHGATKDLAKHTKEADILIVAIGKANSIKAHMVKKDAVVIDVGINKINDPSSPKGYKLIGDVDFEEVYKKVSYLTPVPGGVGPMTCAILLKNTLQVVECREEIKS